MSCCNNVNVRTTAVAFATNTLTYTIGAGSFIVGRPYNIIFGQTIPSTTTIGSSVVISDGTTNYNIFTRKGYTLQTKNIVNKGGLKVWFNGTSFILRNFIEV